MKLLVTGGSGFIGSNFILYWLSHHTEDQIVNFDSLTYAGNPENLKSVETDSRYRFIKADICDLKSVSDAMVAVDIVVHFAAESHVDRSISDPEIFIKTNVNGTYTLLEAALSAGVKRFHHISTDEVFGTLALGSREKFKETTQYDPSSPYSASKAASDHLVRAYHRTYGLPITISNCSNNFGPFQHPEKLIPLAITNLILGKKIPVYGDGQNVRDWLYVEDHCRAIEMILEKGKVGQTYCVGGQTSDTSNLAIVKMILNLMQKGEDQIEFVTDRPGHDRRYAIDWSKIKNELGWQPVHTFEEWLSQTVKWYQDHVSWWKDHK